MGTPHIASRNQFPARANMTGGVLMLLRVTFGASGAPTVASTDATDISISRSGTGSYVISTPNANSVALVGAVAEPATAATRVWLATPVTGRSASAGTVPVIHWNGSAAADPANGDAATFLLLLNGSR